MDIREYRSVATRIVNRRTRGTPHGDLVKAVVQRLCLMPGVLVIQHNTGALKAIGAKGKERIVRYGYPGMADLYVRVKMANPPATLKATRMATDPEVDRWLRVIEQRMFPWRTLWLECKVPPDSQRPDQEAFQQTMEHCGDDYRIVTSADDAVRAVGEVRG